MAKEATAQLARGLLILVVVLAALAVPAHAAPANAIIVTQQSDTLVAGKCRLRDAIIAANTNTGVFGCAAGAPGLDVITFSLSIGCRFIQCVLLLTGPLPAVTEALTINGSPSNLEISGENLYRVFDLGPVPVTLSNLRIVKGQSSDIGGGIRMAGSVLTVNQVVFSANHANFNGGAIDEGSGTLFVYNSAFLGNSSSFGGAIAQIGGSATISDSTFSANTGDDGGAVGAVAISSLQVTHSVFDGNSATVWGGAIYLQDQTVQATITASTFTHNQVLTTPATYGGAALWMNSGTLTLADSTLANNDSQTEAGGLGISGGQATLTNVTLSGNTARRDGGGIRAASDGLNNPATLNLNNVTITGNTADSDNNDTGSGGGLRATSGTINIQNSILAGNFDTPNNSGAGTVHPDCSATLASPSHNLMGRIEGCVGIIDGSVGNHVGSAGSPLNPQLAPLADNGGPTFTHALLSASLAINGGHPLTPGSGGLACAAADQRGVTRPLGTRCDAGAFEAGMRAFLSLISR